MDSQGEDQWLTFALVIAAAMILAAAGIDPLAGTFEGTSVCQVKASPCRDEHVLYRLTPTKSRGYRIDAYKLVAGKQIFMGPIDVRFDTATRRLHGLLMSGGQSRGTVDLTLTGSHLTGTIELPDGTLYRLIEADKH
jgi:hypothetical protein